MCKQLIHNEKNIITLNRRDPTRTTVLRNTFVQDMNRRFKELAKSILIAVFGEDVFGLKNPVNIQRLQALQANTPGRRAFDFPRNRDKISAFMDWIRRQIQEGILDVRDITQVGESIEAAWTNKYIFDSYSRGVTRARAQLKTAGFNVPTIAETGGINLVMQAPIHLDRVGILYTRAFNELRGITASMEQQISRILSEGLIKGLSPRTLAKAINSATVGIAADLGLEISYVSPSTGRLIRYYMPARRRAEILARTEIIRAHAEGTLQEYQNWRVTGVEVKAEFVTAGDERVCAECEALEGNTYTIEEAHGIIPVHPQCRCVWIPKTIKT